MTKKKDIEKQIEFIHLLKDNKLTTPNEFTIGMGNLIKQAREEKEISQADLAKALNRRQGTISDIENGKSEIGILTLVQFAVELQKPISYFIPNTLLKDYIVDVKTKFEHELLDFAREMEAVEGDIKLIRRILDALRNRYRELYETEGYDIPEEDEEDS